MIAYGVVAPAVIHKGVHEQDHDVYTAERFAGDELVGQERCVERYEEQRREQEAGPQMLVHPELIENPE